MNLRRRFRRITLVLAIIGGILGLVGVATVLDEHDYANIDLRSEQGDYKDGYKPYKIFFMLMQILWKGASSSDDELNELWKEWTEGEMPTEEGTFYTDEEFLKKIQEGKAKKIEDGFRVNLDSSDLVVVYVLVWLVGTVVAYFGTWVVVRFGGIAITAIYKFIRWLIFGFYDVIAGVILLFAKGTHSSVIIDGQVLKAGDTIHGVKVIKVLKGKVEFEKNGQRWTRKVKETPAPEWR